MYWANIFCTGHFYVGFYQQKLDVQSWATGVFRPSSPGGILLLSEYITSFNKIVAFAEKADFANVDAFYDTAICRKCRDYHIFLTADNTEFRVVTMDNTEFGI